MNGPENLKEKAKEYISGQESAEQTEKTDKNKEISKALEELKSKLDSLQSNIDKSFTEKERENLTSFLDDLLNIENNKEILNVKEKLQQGKGIEVNDLETVKEVVKGFEKRVNSMEKKEKDAIIEASEKNLQALKQEVDPLQNNPKKKLKEEILGKAKKSSIFGLGLFSAGNIIDDIMNYFEKKYGGEEEKEEEGGFFSKLGLDFNLDGLWVKIKLGMLSMFAPDIYKNLQKYEKLLSGGASEIVDGAREAAESNELSPEQVEELGKESKSYIKKLIEKVNPDIEDKNYNKFFDEWWTNIKKNGIKLKNQSFEEVINKLKGAEIPSISAFVEILGFGSFAVIEFLSVGYKYGIVDLKTISVNTGKEVLNTGIDIVQQSIMFVPNIMGMVIGQVPMEDVLDFLKEKRSIPEEYRTPILVMIYRGLDTKAGGVLKELAALPGHIVSTVAGQLGEDASKLKVIGEAIKNTNIEKRLEILAKIEKSLGIEKPLYDGVKKSLKTYKKGLALSSIYGVAKKGGETGADFLTKLQQMTDNQGNKIFDSLDIDEFKKISVDDIPLEKMDNHQLKSIQHEIANQIEQYSVKVRKIEMKGTDFLKSGAKFFKGKFSQQNFAEKLANDLSDSLYKNYKVLSNEKIWDEKILRGINKLKAGLKTHTHTDAYDLSRLMNEDGKVLEKIRILAKSSPEMIKFLFGEFPVILLGKEQFVKMAENLNEGNFTGASKELINLFAYLTPIIGPVTFICENMEEINLGDIGVGSIWFGIDGFCLYGAYRAAGGGLKGLGGISREFRYGPRAMKNVVKGASQGVVGFRELGKNIKMLKRGGRGITTSVREAFAISKGKPKMAIAALVLGIGIWTTAEVADACYMDDAEELEKRIKEIEKENGNLENYIRINRENGGFNEEEKKYIVKFTMMNYLPLQNPESITEIEFEKDNQKGDVIRAYMPNSVLTNMPEGVLQQNMERFKEIFGSSVEVRQA